MKKVIIIGCPGSGKSTFARRLRNNVELPLFYLDMIWHKPDRTNITEDEFDLKLQKIIAQDEWIIDGNYLRTLEIRLQNCDTVFFFDFPLKTCLEGARNRVGKEREDMPWVEESFDTEFESWIKDFHKTQLPKVRALLEKYNSKSIITFETRDEIESYIFRYNS